MHTYTDTNTYFLEHMRAAASESVNISKLTKFPDLAQETIWQRVQMVFSKYLRDAIVSINLIDQPKSQLPISNEWDSLLNKNVMNLV